MDNPRSKTNRKLAELKKAGGDIMAYRNSRDRSWEAKRRATEEARAKAAREAAARLAELDRKVARIEGMRDTLRNLAFANEELREAVRVALSAKVSGATVGKHVNAELFIVVPGGLPDGLSNGDV